MGIDFIRLWVQEDVEAIAKHLLIAGQTASQCGNCKELGLDFSQAKSCPKCQTEFRYLTSRFAAGQASDRYFWVKRMIEKRPELKVIDYDDFHKTLARIKAKQFFNG